MYERTVRPLTEDELARVRRQRESMRANMTDEGGLERGLAACGSALGAVAGMLIALFLWWSAGGQNGELAGWLLAGGVLGATWGYGLGRGAGKAIAGCGAAALAGEPADAELQASVLRCSVTGAVAVPMCGAGELLLLDVGDGRLLALNSVVGYGTRLAYLGFPHERFELAVVVGSVSSEMLLSYHGEGETIMPQRSIPRREAKTLPFGCSLANGKLFRGTLDTCLEDLKAALGGD